MPSQWEANCEFCNVFMQERGTKRTVRVMATKVDDAKREARLQTCREIGLSTMMHTYVRVRKIKNIDQT